MKKLTPAAQGAKQLKEVLQKAFPNVTFSCRSENFSGGDAIRIAWTFGPTNKEVEKISSYWKEGSFDGMQDMYTYNDEISSYTDAAGNTIKPERAKYVSTTRYFFAPDETRGFSSGKSIGILAEILCRDVFRIEYNGYNTDAYGEFRGADGKVDSQARQLLYATSFPSEKIEITGIQDLGKGGWCHLSDNFQVVYNDLGTKAAAAPISGAPKDLELVEYSEKALAVFGSTREIAAALKDLGGRFNRALTHPETKQRLAGWIFSKKSESKIKATLQLA